MATRVRHSWGLPVESDNRSCLPQPGRIQVELVQAWPERSEDIPGSWQGYMIQAVSYSTAFQLEEIPARVLWSMRVRSERCSKPVLANEEAASIRPYKQTAET